MADYYVDNTVPGTGTLIDPWDDIATNINTLIAGDTMHVRGDALPLSRVHTESISITVDGADGSPITLIPFAGEGVTLKSAAWSDIIDITGDWIVIDGFELDKDGVGNYMIDIFGDHDTVKDCELYEFWDTAIRISSDYAEVDTCIIRDGFKANNDDSLGITINTGLHTHIHDCTIYDVAGDCIQVWNGGGDVGGTIIEDCELYTTLANCSENAIDIKKGHASHQSIIRRNVMHGFRYCDATCGGSGGGIGEAVIVHLDAQNMLICDNVIYNCASGIRVSASDTDLYRNEIYDLVFDGATWGNIAIFIYSCSNVNIWNNTLDDCHLADGQYSIVIDGTTAGIVVQNNILNDCGDVDGTPDTCDHNCWFNVVSSWVGAGDVNADPLFTNEAGNIFTLQAASPCIDAGVDVGLPYQGTAPDDGAHEYEYVPPAVTVYAASALAVDSPCSRIAGRRQ